MEGDDAAGTTVIAQDRLSSVCVLRWKLLRLQQSVNHSPVHLQVSQRLEAQGAGIGIPCVRSKAVRMHEMATGKLLRKFMCVTERGFRVTLPRSSAASSRSLEQYPTLTGRFDSKSISEQTGQSRLSDCSLHLCLLNSSRLMHALHAMQWNESMPGPLPCEVVHVVTS